MPRNSILAALACAALLLVTSPARAGTIKVPKDHATIQQAVDAAAADDTVQVSKGVYRENVVVNTTITLKGSGAIIDGGYSGDCLLVNAADVTVTGFTLVYGGGFADADGPVLTGGLHVTGTGTGVEISKLTITACEAYGIQLETSGSITSCKIDSCPGTGIDIDTNAPTSEALTVIQKNTVTRCSQGMSLQDGPFSVVSNTVTSSSGNGIEIQMALPGEGSVIAPPSVISKNKCNGNFGTGLLVSAFLAGPVTLVEKNTCDANGTGLSLGGLDIDVESNTITDNVRSGIFVLAGSCTLNKNKVQRNAGCGIWVGSTEPPIVDGPTLDQNVLTSNTVQDSGGDGIHVTSGANALEKNTVKANKGDGIDIDASLGNSLMENKLQDNKHDGIDNSGTLTILHANNVKKCGGKAIAGAGDGAGTVDGIASTDNVVDDDSDLAGFTTPGALELQTVFVLP